jgi:hypothetical protein
MSQYKITYTAYPIHGKYHFSGCRAVIEGETFDEAVKCFSKQQRDKGYIIGFVVEGDMFEITFYDLEDKDIRTDNK